MTRRPHRTRLPRSWWRARADHRWYMLREATVLPLLFFIGCLIAGMFALQRGQPHWIAWLDFMQAPWVRAWNGLALVASLFHAGTFFGLVPQVLSPTTAQSPSLSRLLIALQWTALILVLWGLWGLVRGGV